MKEMQVHALQHTDACDAGQSNVRRAGACLHLPSSRMYQNQKPCDDPEGGPAAPCAYRLA